MTLPDAPRSPAAVGADDPYDHWGALQACRAEVAALREQLLEVVPAPTITAAERAALDRLEARRAQQRLDGATLVRTSDLEMLLALARRAGIAATSASDLPEGIGDVEGVMDAELDPERLDRTRQIMRTAFDQVKAEAADAEVAWEAAQAGVLFAAVDVRQTARYWFLKGYAAATPRAGGA